MRLKISGVAIVLAMLSASLSGASAQESREIRIVRDRFGVPHVYAATDEDVAFGAGYALAQDRLWQMHTFRLIGKGQLSELVGPLGVATDKTIRFFTYTQAERARRFDAYPEDIRALLQAFADGINRHIAEVRADPSKLPFEFVEYGIGPPRDWTVDDSVALGDVLILAFGSGGGNELNHANLLKALIERHGSTAGRRMFNDLVVTEDPDGPMTIPRGYNYKNEPTFVRVAEAQARRGLEDDARISMPDASGSTTQSASDAPRGTLEQLALIPDVDKAARDLAMLQRGLAGLERVFSFGSNAQIAGPRLSRYGNSLQTGGPQVGYLLPQWLVDIGLHGDSFDTTGMTFAGVGPAVLIGRGPGYAWTTTTGASDLTDTFVEKLDPADRKRYEFNGAFEPMECRTETYTFRGVAFDRNEICRTRHGPVVSFDTANNVAYSLRYAWFNREQQTVEGFFRYNQVQSVRDFATFSNYLSSNHNMFYTDDRGNYGFWHPGNHPLRARGIDMRLPQDGRGGSEWRGLMSIQAVPHAVNFDRGWLANWNNQPALGWKRERGHPALDNAIDLEAALSPSGAPVKDPFGGPINPDGRLTYADMSANLRYGAFKHHNDTYFRPFLPAPAALDSPLARRAVRAIRAWDGHNTDADGDGLYDSPGRTIIDRWVATMRATAFSDELGNLASWARDDHLWHLLNGNDRLTFRHDWLNGTRVGRFKAEAFEQAARDLAEQFGTNDVDRWREKIRKQHYQRLNADLFTDTAAGAMRMDNSSDSGFPGDVADHIAMDRGTYNHIVAYLQPPKGSGRLGRAASRAGSVIPPGQSGYVSLTGREAPHYEDQLALYVEWRYKPMPLTLGEALALKESETVIRR